MIVIEVFKRWRQPRGPPDTGNNEPGQCVHDPAWQIHSYGLLKAELANGKACVSSYGDGFQPGKRVPSHPR